MGWNHVISEFLYRMLTGTPFTIHGTGNETRSFCYISDAVNASILAATSPATLGEVLNIGNPQELRINDLVTNLEDITGIRVERHYIPFQGAGTSRRVPSITKVERLIGYVPKVNLRDGLARTSEWCRKELEKHHKLTHISDKIVIDFSTDALNSGSTVLPQQPIESSM